jgi:hypothetical protein
MQNSLDLKNGLDQIDFNWCVKWYLQAYQIFEMTYFISDETLEPLACQIPVKSNSNNRKTITAHMSFTQI